MEEFVSIISNLGFPIAVTFYLLTRFERKLDDLTKTVGELNDVVGALNAVIKDRKNGNGN